MNFTREQVIEMRQKADAYACSQTNDLHDLGRIADERLCTLAADRALEAAAQKCDDNEFADGAECAQFIRAMKEQA